MKLNLLITLLIVLLFSGSAFTDVGDPDPDGIVDTVALEITIDWDNNKVVAEVYNFTDYNINGSTIGFTWGESTANLWIDSAVGSPLLNNLTLVSYYENDDIATTNTNKRFVFGTLDFGNGIPGDANGRRLWATYYFSMTWSQGDCISLDTLTFSVASTLLYANEFNHTYAPNISIPTQEDPDQDGISVSCDNCPDIYNPLQEDSDHDGIGNACCCIKRGDVAVPLDGSVLVNDLVFLVDYLFKSGISIGCPEQGDCAVPLDGSILVNDLVYLVNYLFKSGPPPPEC